ncbi:MAG: hypothetical protein IJ958_11775 [Agathobacter sp.]|nr:hypothetical protein [Agathobacter sp.]
MKLGNLSSEEISSRLILTAINYEENKKELEEFPFLQKGSIALMTLLCAGEKNESGNYNICVAVSNKMLESWGFERSMLFDVAADNSKKMFPTMYQAIGNYLDPKELNKMSFLSGEINVADIIVLSNEMHFNGAATMFYDSAVLDKIAGVMESEKVILLPSSSNQIYCVPYRSQKDLQECQTVFMQHVIEIGEADALTNNALLYDCNSKKVTEMNGESYDLSLTESYSRRVEHRR